MAKGAANVSSVASTTTSTTLLSANPGRNMFVIHNTDANALHIKFGTTATTTTSFTVMLAQNERFECPLPVYTGRVDGIWATDGTGAAVITEW